MKYVIVASHMLHSEAFLLHKKTTKYCTVPAKEAQPIKDGARKALSQIFLNPKTYFEHSVPVDCGFRPGIAFRFSDGIIEVDVLVCFSCRELRYYSAGKLVGESHFKSPEILALTKKLFPDDKIIQALK